MKLIDEGQYFVKSLVRNHQTEIPKFKKTQYKKNLKISVAGKLMTMYVKNH